MRNIQRQQAVDYVRILAEGLAHLQSKDAAEVFILPRLHYSVTW